MDSFSIQKGSNQHGRNRKNCQKRQRHRHCGHIPYNITVIILHCPIHSQIACKHYKNQNQQHDIIFISEYISQVLQKRGFLHCLSRRIDFHNTEYAYAHNDDYHDSQNNICISVSCCQCSTCCVRRSCKIVNHRDHKK